MVAMYPEIGEKINLKIIRAIRVLRPLKLVSRVPSELVAIYFHFIPFEIINLEKDNSWYNCINTVPRAIARSLFECKHIYNDMA